MTDQREQLIRKVQQAVRNPNWGKQTTYDDARIAVDTVLATVTPLIEAALIERLAERAAREPLDQFCIDSADWMQEWLRAQPEAKGNNHE